VRSCGPAAPPARGSALGRDAFLGFRPRQEPSPAPYGLHLRPLRLEQGVVGHAEVGADDVDNGLTVLRVVLGEVVKGVQSAEPDRGLLVAKLLDGPGVAVGDLALLAELELVAAGRRCFPDLVAGRSHLSKGHARTDAGSGQDQNGAEAL
jgi:hypothetical protein